MTVLKLNGLSNKQVELQFDIKKMPGEKEKSGKFAPLMNTDFGEEEMFFINAEL